MRIKKNSHSADDLWLPLPVRRGRVGEGVRGSRGQRSDRQPPSLTLPRTYRERGPDRRFGIALLSAVALAAPALAGSATWTGGGADNNWITAANWSAAVAPSDAAAIYTFSGTTRLSPNVDQNWLTGRLQFSATGFTVTNSPGATLSLAGTLNASILNNSAAGLNSVVSAPITVVAATGGVASTGRTLDTGTGSVALNGGIDIGTFNFIKIGAGILDLPTANTMASTASFAANNGTVRVGSNTSLGSATFVHNSGLTVPASTAVTSTGGNTVRLLPLSTAVPITLNNNINLGGAGALVIGEAAAVAQTTATMTLAGTVMFSGTKSIAVDTNALAAITGNIVDGATPGRVGKGNPGTLILSGNNTFSGGFDFFVGNVRAASDTAFGTGTFFATNSGASVPTQILQPSGGPRTFANALNIGGPDTFQIGSAGFINDVTFTGPTTIVSRNVGNTPATTDDDKAVTVAAGMTATFGPIGEANAGSGLVKSGPGTLAFSGPSTYTGLTTISNGTLRLNGGASFGLGAVTNNAAVVLAPTAAGPITVANVVGGAGTLSHTGSGTATLTGANTYTGATIVDNAAATLKVTYAAAGTSAASPLLSAPGGADIQRGAVVFDYSASTSPAATVRSLLAASFADAVTPGVMDGGQLRSSTATITKGIGYKDDGAGNVIVKIALFGDADLDGGVSINDFNTLAGNFGAANEKVWTDGDFDYDGGVSINDFNLLAGGFGQSLPPSSEAWTGLLAFAAAHNDLAAFEAVTGVPEPTSLLVGLAPAAALLRRRRTTGGRA